MGQKINARRPYLCIDCGASTKKRRLRCLKCRKIASSRNAKIDITGQKFNRLTVKEDVGRSKCGVVLWRCVCDCGNSTISFSTRLRSGHAKSCGCLQREAVKATGIRNIKYHTEEERELANKRYNKTYYNKNKDRFKEASRKQRKQLMDGYVRMSIHRHHNVDYKDITPRMVELKRMQLKFHREIDKGRKLLRKEGRL